MRDHIFIVEDNKDILKLLEKRFSKLQYEVSTYSNGQEAAEALESKIPDLIITDLMMPRIDGIELIEYANQVDSNLKFIIYSGKDSLRDMEKAAIEGCFYYVSKTSGPEVLIDKVDTILSEKKNQQSDHAIIYMPKEAFPIKEIIYEEDRIVIVSSDEIPIGAFVSLKTKNGYNSVLKIEELWGTFGEYYHRARIDMR